MMLTFRLLLMMPTSGLLLLLCLLTLSSAAAVGDRGAKLPSRQDKGPATLYPVVDLGYSVYEGYYDETSQLNVFKGYVRINPLETQQESVLMQEGFAMQLRRWGN
jgi:hypothetical protein